MRLIVQYDNGDKSTFASEVTVPVIYGSAEAFLVHFEAHFSEWIAARARGEWPVALMEFSLGGQHFYCDNFVDNVGAFLAPEIMTVDEFFAKVELVVSLGV